MVLKARAMILKTRVNGIKRRGLKEEADAD